MKIVFFGTPFFAAENLQCLLNNGEEIVAVVTPPDSKKGRGKILKSCAVKETALENNLLVLQPEKLRSNDFINNLNHLNAELFIVVAFRMLPEAVWKIPKKGTINLHASLLPNYRGAAPINWTLINGEKETGISTFFINERIDSGAILVQKKVKLTENTTAAQLHNILINKGNDILIESLYNIKNNNINPIIQEEIENTTKAPKLTKELLKINWKKSANDIHNLVRGLSPFLDNSTTLKDISICPSAWFMLECHNGKQKRIKVHLTKIVKSESNNILQIKSDNKNYLHISTNKDIVSIIMLQVEGKKPITIQQFLQGNKITAEHKII